MSEFSTKQHRAIRAVAYIEAFKGFLAFAAASGFMLLMHKDVAEFALHLVQHAHLNPGAHYPSIFIAAAANVHDARLLLMAGGAAVYSIIRMVEAYGLLNEKTWAEVLAAIGGAIYVPFEVLGLIHEPNLFHVVLLAINLAIVALMLNALRQRRKAA
jgi:uncharacterized membrane protein (DUF2068 family)